MIFQLKTADMLPIFWKLFVYDNKLIVIHKWGNKTIAELRDFLLLFLWKNDAKT